jgi:hypothetical protein
MVTHSLIHVVNCRGLFVKVGNLQWVETCSPFSRFSLRTNSEWQRTKVSVSLLIILLDEHSKVAKFTLDANNNDLKLHSFIKFCRILKIINHVLSDSTTDFIRHLALQKTLAIAVGQSLPKFKNSKSSVQTVRQSHSQHLAIPRIFN